MLAVQPSEPAGDRLQAVALGPVPAPHDAFVCVVSVDGLQHAVRSPGPGRDPRIIAVQAVERRVPVVRQGQRSPCQGLACPGAVRWHLLTGVALSCAISAAKSSARVCTSARACRADSRLSTHKHRTPKLQKPRTTRITTGRPARIRPGQTVGPYRRRPSATPWSPPSTWAGQGSSSWPGSAAVPMIVR